MLRQPRTGAWFGVADNAFRKLLDLLRQRFSHLQHGMVILFVCELTRNLPSLTEIELHGNRIRPNHAKAACLVTTGCYLSFTLHEQSAATTPCLRCSRNT